MCKLKCHELYDCANQLIKNHAYNRYITQFVSQKMNTVDLYFHGSLKNNFTIYCVNSSNTTLMLSGGAENSIL